MYWTRRSSLAEPSKGANEVARFRDRRMEGGLLLNHLYEHDGRDLVRVRGLRAAKIHLRLFALWVRRRLRTRAFDPEGTAAFDALSKLFEPWRRRDKEGRRRA